MPAPRRVMQAAELLHGEDHDFITNIYLAALRRWPDAAGYNHFQRLVANRPEARIDALREICGSEEARRAGALVEIPAQPVPGDPWAAALAVGALRAEVLAEETGRLRAALELLTGTGGADYAALQRDLAEASEAALRADIAALRQELRAARPAPAPAPAPSGPVLALAEALAALLGPLEARLAALEARLPPAP